MHARVDRAGLIAAYKNISRIVKENRQEPVWGNVVFREGGAERIILEGSDNEVAIRETLHCAMIDPEPFVLRVTELGAVVKGLMLEDASDDVELLNEGAGFTLTVTSGDSKWKVHGDSAKNQPVIPCISPSCDDAHFFAESSALSRTIKAFDILNWDHRFSCALLEENDGRLRVVSTDSVVLLVDDLEEADASPTEGLSARVPMGALKKARGLLPKKGMCRIDVDAHVLSLSFDTTEIILRKSDAHFPRYESLVPSTSDCKQEIKLERKALEKAVKILDSFNVGSEITKALFDLTGEHLTMSFQVAERGCAERKIPLSAPDAIPMTWRMNSGYVAAYCKAIDDAEIDMRLASPERPVVFVGRSRPGFRFVIMPCNL